MKLVKICIMIGCLLFACMDFVFAANDHNVSADEQMRRLLQQERKTLAESFKYHHPVTNWNEKIKLNDEQKAKLLFIYQGRQDKINAVARQINELKQQLDEEFREDDKRIRRELNPQQQVLFDKEKRRQARIDGNDYDGEKPSRKRMRQYGDLPLQ